MLKSVKLQKINSKERLFQGRHSELDQTSRIQLEFMRKKQ